MNLNELEDNTYKVTSAHDFHDNNLRKKHLCLKQFKYEQKRRFYKMENG